PAGPTGRRTPPADGGPTQRAGPEVRRPRHGLAEGGGAEGLQGREAPEDGQGARAAASPRRLPEAPPGIRDGPRVMLTGMGVARVGLAVAYPCGGPSCLPSTSSATPWARFASPTTSTTAPRPFAPATTSRSAAAACGPTSSTPSASSRAPPPAPTPPLA